MQANTENIKQLIMSAIDLINTNSDCGCRHALAEYGGFKL
jgi:5'-methylthioadenosine phosphorylase